MNILQTPNNKAKKKADAIAKEEENEIAKAREETDKKARETFQPADMSSLSPVDINNKLNLEGLGVGMKLPERPYQGNTYTYDMLGEDAKAEFLKKNPGQFAAAEAHANKTIQEKIDKLTDQLFLVTNNKWVPSLKLFSLSFKYLITSCMHKFVKSSICSSLSHTLIAILEDLSKYASNIDFNCF